MDPLEFLEKALSELRAAGLLRADPHPPFVGLDLCSNDYLGYGRTPVSRATLLACEGIPSGAGASRLIQGTAASHLELEADLASWVGLDAALLFSSGYAANVGLLSALCAPGDLIVSDRLNHASIIDGAKLSRATVVVVPHLSTDAVSEALEASNAARKWVVTETYFSMDADIPELVALREICNRHRAGLVVDEAHALGTHGPEGGGLCRAAGIRPDALVGTLGKAIGMQGAFVAGSSALRSWLWNRARSLVFSTGTSPLMAALTRDNVRRARADDAARARLHRVSAELRAALLEAGLNVPSASSGPIVPVLLGTNARAVLVAERLARAGLRVQAIRPPTVPEGTARIRLTASAVLSDADLTRVAACVIDACSGS